MLTTISFTLWLICIEASRSQRSRINLYRSMSVLCILPLVQCIDGDIMIQLK
jgi:hypothetical protein